jgi:large subunit ribosomal protein L29
MAKLKLKEHNKSLGEKSLADLRQALLDAKEEMFNLRFQRATGNLENHRNIRKAKREIARIHTAIRAKELAEAGKGVTK